MTTSKFGLVLVVAFLAACGSSIKSNPDDLSSPDGTHDMVQDQSDDAPLDVRSGDDKEDSLTDTEDGSLPDVPDDKTTPPTDVDQVDPDVKEDTQPDQKDVPDSTDADTAEVVVPPCVVGEPCDDLNACTLEDQCVDGVCVGTPMACYDGIDCTFDTCKEGECVFPPKPGWCYIWEQCWQEGEVNPNNPCLECVTAHRIYTWTPDDTNSCDDETVCTVLDACIDGECVGTAMLCDDANPCTLDVCEAGQCQFILQEGLLCDDGNICTMSDVCHSGVCEGGDDQRECDDFNPCTVDSCDPSMGCIYTPFNGFCDDGNECTVGDKCVSAICKSGTAVVCNDDNICTTDYCNPLVGCKFINNALPCDDHDPCSVGDKCLGGICKKGPDQLVCEDDNTCTMEACVPGVGCKFFPIVNAQCSDFNSCTYGDHCVDGECKYDFKVECDDGNPCTDDVCDGAFGCAHFNNSHPCDDGNECTAGDQCIEGVCHTGLLPVHCFEENPCLEGYCDPAVGCIGVPQNGAPCNDGDACTLDDTCADGECVHGLGSLSCDDGNVCTIDYCDPIFGCVQEPITLPCNDYNICTKNDRCLDGVCKGFAISCDDNNSCTADSCDVSQGCGHSVLVNEFCQPRIVIDSPVRAAELYGPPTTVLVQGHVVHNAAPAAWIRVNGYDVAVGEDGTFELTIPAHQGINLLEAEIFDMLNGKDKVVQTFVLAESYTPMNTEHPEVSRINPALKMFLAQSVWDDNNPTKDDFATFIILFFEALDFNTLLPNPLTENGDYRIETDTGLLYDHLDLDLTCMDGFLRMRASLVDIYIGINAKSKHWYLPSVDGSAAASSVTVDIDVYFYVDANGNVTADMQNVQTGVHDLNVELDNDIVEFLFGWIVNFFEGTFAGMVEDMMTDTIYEQVPPLLESAMEQLAFSTTVTMPSLLGMDPKTITMDVKVSGIYFKPGGATVHLAGAALLDKGNTVDSKGAAARTDCLTGVPPHAFNMLKEVEMGISDDFLNQLLFAVWWSGLLEMDVGADMLGGGNFEEYGISNLSINVKALRAPLVSDCESGSFEMRLGDLELEASMNMFGNDTHVVMYASAAVGLAVGTDLTFVDGIATSILKLGVTEIKWVKLEVATVSENLVGSEDTLRLLVRDQLMPVLLQQLTNGLMASIPIPAIDLSGMVPGLDSVLLRVLIEDAGHEFGYSVLGGRIDE